MLMTMTKTVAAAAFAVGFALTGLAAGPADAAPRAGGGGHGGGGGGFHGGSGGFHGGSGGFHGGSGGFSRGGGFRGGNHYAGGGYRGGYGGGYGYGAAALGVGLLGGAIIASQYPYYDSGYGYGYGYGDGAGYGVYQQGYQQEGYEQGNRDDSSASCASRFKSYDPASGTYLGYDGDRHACPVS